MKCCNWCANPVGNRWVVCKDFPAGISFVLENDAGHAKKFRSEGAANSAADELNRAPPPPSTKD